MKNNPLQGRIAFSMGNRRIYDIWIIDPVQKKISCVIQNSAWNDFPRWSPDGKQLLFSSNLPGYFALHKLNLKNEELKQVTFSQSWDGTASWSPDGARIVFSSRSTGSYNLWMMDAEGEHLEQLTTGNFNDYNPVFSPDGKKILFVSNRSKSEELWLLDMETLQLTKATEMNQKCVSPAFSRGGTQVAFLCRNPKNSAYPLWQLDLATGSVQKLAERKGKGHSLCWSPDGRYILYSGMDDPAGVFIDLKMQRVPGGETADSKNGETVLPNKFLRAFGDMDKRYPSWCDS